MTNVQNIQQLKKGNNNLNGVVIFAYLVVTELLSVCQLSRNVFTAKGEITTIGVFANLNLGRSAIRV